MLNHATQLTISTVLNLYLFIHCCTPTGHGGVLLGAGALQTAGHCQRRPVQDGGEDQGEPRGGAGETAGEAEITSGGGGETGDGFPEHTRASSDGVGIT